MHNMHTMVRMNTKHNIYTMLDMHTMPIILTMHDIYTMLNVHTMLRIRTMHNLLHYAKHARYAQNTH